MNRLFALVSTVATLALLGGCSGGGHLEGEDDLSSEYTRSIGTTKQELTAVAAHVTKQDRGKDVSVQVATKYQYGVESPDDSKEFCVWMKDTTTGVSLTYRSGSDSIERNVDGMTSCSPGV